MWISLHDDRTNRSVLVNVDLLAAVTVHEDLGTRGVKATLHLSGGDRIDIHMSGQSAQKLSDTIDKVSEKRK